MIPRPVTASLVALLALAACAREPAPDRDALAAQAALRVPADARLADLYVHSCRACHTVAASGAPLTGDRDGWRVRWQKGLPALVASAVQGLNGMPAGGQCVRCTAGDYAALIRFMAGEERR
jgi:cytochrome c5